MTTLSHSSLSLTGEQAMATSAPTLPSTHHSHFLTHHSLPVTLCTITHHSHFLTHHSLPVTLCTITHHSHFLTILTTHSLTMPPSFPQHSLTTSPALPHHSPSTPSPLPQYSLTTSPELPHHFPSTPSPLPQHSLTTPQHSLTTSPALPHHFPSTPSPLPSTPSPLPQHSLTTPQHSLTTSPALPPHPPPPHHFGFNSHLARVISMGNSPVGSTSFANTSLLISMIRTCSSTPSRASFMRPFSACPHAAGSCCFTQALCRPHRITARQMSSSGSAS